MLRADCYISLRCASAFPFEQDQDATFSNEVGTITIDEVVGDEDVLYMKVDVRRNSNQDWAALVQCGVWAALVQCGAWAGLVQCGAWARLGWCSVGRGPGVGDGHAVSYLSTGLLFCVVPSTHLTAPPRYPSQSILFGSPAPPSTRAPLHPQPTRTHTRHATHPPTRRYHMY